MNSSNNTIGGVNTNVTHPSRRLAIQKIACMLTSLSGFGCSKPQDRDSSSDPGQELDVYKKPLSVPVYPVSSPSLPIEAIRSVVKYSQPPTVIKVIPISVVYHAIRLWGTSATFPNREFANPLLRGRWGEVMFAIMTDDNAYQEYASTSSSSHLLLPSDHGVMARVADDGGNGGGTSSTHPGAYLQIMAELGVSSEERLHVIEREESTLADVINDEALRVSLLIEQEWIANGLSRYLKNTKWQNRFGDWISFDLIAEKLVNRKLAKGACQGGHVPYALASLLAVQEQRELLSPKVVNSVENHLRAYSKLLSSTQREDGGWDRGWDGNSIADNKSALETSRSLRERLVATGHHLEWMTICKPALRPDDSVMHSASLFLSREIERTGRSVEMDWHKYMPLTHSAKAVLNAQGYLEPDQFISFLDTN
ncbi:hypothetical protein Pan153_33030 [Gimesia panareensis]|uniref:Squalene cyclase C-terminal domain-containing protein n=1 Tax=Gimesia panareensis TaxID=2527978 RepID=A0A518FQM5_9PLAN|nr:hypothetical protein [Gimesia panareensis]QDV18643.1 hypothetical protein Pan153_33030 [Gimesia panareensis]